tara:strand:- start:3831 stop:4583 length:753 start_codon:yes stop_codon:yes gene_type:complete
MILYNDDCFNIFPKIEDKSIELFLLDLPYANKKFGKCTACGWDTPIDLEKMWVEIKRMMKPSAIIVFFCNTKFGYTLINSNPKLFSYQLIWEKSKAVGFLNSNKKPLVNIENIYIFKKKQGTYNPQKIKGKPYNKTNTGNNNNDSCAYGKIDRSNHLEGEEHRRINLGDRHPTSILKFKSLGKGTIHRTQKPVDLLEWLIKTYTNEEDLVMDFCMGSGSCGMACKNTNRKFIGIEKDEEIFKLAEERLKN